MKKFNNFMNSASYWKVFVMAFIGSGLVVFVTFNNLIYDPKLTTIILIKMSAAMGVIIGGMITLTTHMGRNSIKFWDACRIFEDDIEKATTKKELDGLYKKDFKELRSLAGGTIHYNELHRLYAILKTKHKFVN